MTTTSAIPPLLPTTAAAASPTASDPGAPSSAAVDPRTGTLDVTVGVFNIQRFGYVIDRGHCNLRRALDFLLTNTPTPPDVLALPEAHHGRDDGERPIRYHTAYYLSQHLADGWYEPLFSRHRSGGHLFLTLVNTARVRPVGWAEPLAALDPGITYSGWAFCEIAGHKVNLACEHWSGGEGRGAFDQAANRLAAWGGDHQNTLLLGDFNTDSGWERELHRVTNLDWYTQCVKQGNLHKLHQKGWLNPATRRWEIDTRQLDRLRGEFGFVDMGEESGDPTPTTRPATGQGLRIDRILRSRGFPATPVSYGVAQPPADVSDHAYVYGTYQVTRRSADAPVIDPWTVITPPSARPRG